VSNALAARRSGARSPEPRAAGAGALLADAVVELGAAGCETPRLDAEVLLAHILGSSRAKLLADPEMQLDPVRRRSFADAVRRRARDREPVAYIVGLRCFRRLELAVDARVLIPRPETELLVEAGLGLPRAARVLDVCTGSGAVALALKSERPDLRVAASEVSTDALEVAGENARRLGIEVALMRADLLAGVPDEFDAVLCNPPYVADSERASLPPEISRHEPALALFAGAEGLDVIRALVDQLASRRQVRQVALEIGAGQAPAVRGLLVAAGFPSPRFARDLAGIERVVVAERDA
jgi:release factor glutamine methyltransferase